MSSAITHMRFFSLSSVSSSIFPRFRRNASAFAHGCGRFPGAPLSRKCAIDRCATRLASRILPASAVPLGVDQQAEDLDLVAAPRGRRGLSRDPVQGATVPLPRIFSRVVRLPRGAKSLEALLRCVPSRPVVAERGGQGHRHLGKFGVNRKRGAFFAFASSSFRSVDGVLLLHGTDFGIVPREATERVVNFHLHVLLVDPLHGDVFRDDLEIRRLPSERPRLALRQRRRQRREDPRLPLVHFVVVGRTVVRVLDRIPSPPSVLIGLAREFHAPQVARDIVARQLLATQDVERGRDQVVQAVPLRDQVDPVVGGGVAPGGAEVADEEADDRQARRRVVVRGRGGDCGVRRGRGRRGSRGGGRTGGAVI
ncbi:hypothetical protein ACHAWF_014639, partial [Thalassiosira exigua]